MADEKQWIHEANQAEAAEAKEKEGTGTVPNVTGQEEGKKGELKKALHDLEEQKGDWSKGG